MITVDEIEHALAEADRDGAQIDTFLAKLRRRERARVRTEELMQDYREGERQRILNDLYSDAQAQQEIIRRAAGQSKPVITPEMRRKWQREVDPNER
jgi:hypothetical protein